MTFEWPAFFGLLLLIPALIWLYLRLQQRRQQTFARFAQLSLAKDLLVRGPGWRRHLPPLLYLLAFVVMVIALTRPHTYMASAKNEGVVMLAIDVSLSMRADDLRPNRLEAAKTAARHFIERQPANVRVGIVSFSDSAFVVQTPTLKKEEAVAAVNRLSLQRGTAIGRAIATSLDAIEEFSTGEPPPPRVENTPSPRAQPTFAFTPVPKGQYAPAVIVLLSDGANRQGPSPLDVAPEAAARGVRVYTIGVGKPGAAPTMAGPFGSTPLRLDETTLKRIAVLTDGIYYNATSEDDLQEVYDSLSKKIVLRVEPQEITFVFAGIAVVVLLIGGCLSLWWFNRLP